MSDEIELPSPVVTIEVEEANPIAEGLTDSQDAPKYGDPADPRGWYTIAGLLRGSPLPIPGKCGKQLKNTDPPRYCCQRPAKDRQQCKFHGGRTRVGIASGRYKNGDESAYLKHLPKLIKGAFKDAMEDESLLSLKEDIALWKGRAVELVAQLEKSPPPPWKDALGLANKVAAAYAVEDADLVKSFLDDLTAFLKEGITAQKSYDKTWKQLQVVLDQRRVTAQAEWKRMNDLNAVVSVDDAMLFVRSMLTAIKEVVTDGDMLRRLQERTIQFLPAPGGQQ